MSQDSFSSCTSPALPDDLTPHPFSEIPRLWFKVLQMTEEFFAQEAPRASGFNTLISVLILAAVDAILPLIYVLISGGLQIDEIPPEEPSVMTAVVSGGLVLYSVGVAIIGVLSSFYLSNGLTYIGARVLGGTGKFGAQVYLFSLFFVPLQIAMLLAGLAPCVGGFAVSALGIYMIILDVRAIKVEHRLTTGRAVAAVFAPLIVISSCLFALAVLTLGPAIRDVIVNGFPD